MIMRKASTRIGIYMRRTAAALVFLAIGCLSGLAALRDTIALPTNAGPALEASAWQIPQHAGRL